MSIENVKFATDLLVRSEDTEKDHSLVDMVNVLRNSKHIVTIRHSESDRGNVRDISSAIDFGDINVSFSIIAADMFFAMRNVKITYLGQVYPATWSLNHEQFLTEVDVDVKKTVHNFLLAVTDVL